jgi:hypothetical protein
MKGRIIIYVFTLSIAWAMMQARNGYSQDDDHQLWMNYALTVPVNQKLSWGGDAGFRGFIFNKDWNSFLIRPTVAYRFNYTFQVAGAVALFNTFNKENNNVAEFRIHQEIDVKWPDVGFLEIFQRFRLEERFFFPRNLPSDFNVRLRYLIGAESMDFTFLGSKRPIYFQAMWEGFKTAGEESVGDLLIDRNRLDLSFGHRLSDRFRYEIHYIRQRVNVALEEAVWTTQHVYRIRFFHRLAAKEK